MGTHQVRRANFRLKMAHEPDAAQQLHWQREFEQRYVPLLDRALELWLAERPHLLNRMVEIPRLQLDLGHLDSGVDDDVLVRSLQQQLDRKVPGLLGMDPASWQLQCYLQFLQHGAWPIGSTLSNVADAEVWLLSHPNLGQRLVAHLQSNVYDSRVWQRLQQQHTAHYLQWLAVRFPLLLPVELQAALDQLIDDTKFKSTLMLWLNLWWQHRGKNLYYTNQELQLALLAALRRMPPAPDAKLLGQIVQHIADLGNVDKDTAKPTIRADASVNGAESSDTQLASGILVQQAGVILLHPFLPRLFEVLGLLDGAQFKSDHTRLQALFALHYIATGRQHADESELALHKFLVHWPVDHAVPPSLALDPEQYQEINHMIAEAISQWTVLKNTSIAGLRETFLQRTGSLQKLDEGYRLAITASTVDILLAQLPWQLTLVKLPWLTRPLFVHWGRT